MFARTPKVERLVTWRNAMALSERLYRLTAKFPAEEKSGLVATIRRGVTSVPAKIADAHGRDDPDEAIKALVTAQAAVRELQTHLNLSMRLKFVSGWTAKPAIKRCRNLHKLLGSHIVKLERLREELAYEQEQEMQEAEAAA